MTRLHFRMHLLQFILLLSLAVNSSTLSIGFNINGSEHKKLVIGEINTNASAIQVSSILEQLEVIKNNYVIIRKSPKFTVKIGESTRFKRGSFLAPGEFYLYELDNFTLTDYILSQITVSKASNFSIQSYVTLFSNPLLYIKGRRYLQFNSDFNITSVDESILIDIDDFSTNESVEMSSVLVRPMSPVFDFHDIYVTNQGKPSINNFDDNSNLGAGLLHGKYNKRFIYCGCSEKCTIS